MGQKASQGAGHEDIRRSLSEILDLAVLLGVSPALLAFGFLYWNDHGWTAELTFVVAIHGIAVGIALAGRRDRLPRRGRFYSLYLIALALCTAAIWGPLLGVGIGLMGGVIAAAIFYDTRELLVIQVAALLGLAVVGLDAMASRPSHLEGVDILSAEVWWRVLATAALGMVVLGLLLSSILRSLERAYRETLAALDREREAHHERECLLGELERSRRLEDLGRMAGGIAHDVNNGFAVVLANAELLEGCCHEGESRELVAEIREAALGAKRVVSELMLLGRPVGRRGPTAPSEVVEAMATTLRRLLPERIALDVDTTTRGTIALDESELQRIVMNLVLNARDAIEKAGRISVAVEERSGAIHLSVSDDGVGIEPAVLGRIFDPFFTTKRIGEGNGLGLAAVEGIVRAAGGRAIVESRAGEGTRFEIVLPLAGAAPLSTTAPKVDRVRMERATILFVEDDLAVRRSTARLLRAEGHEVREAGNESEALARLEEVDFDALLTDVVMPDSNVAHLIDAFVERFPGRPVIVCSGWVEEELVRQGIDAGSYVLLHKPFERDALIAALAAIACPS